MELALLGSVGRVAHEHEAKRTKNLEKIGELPATVPLRYLRIHHSCHHDPILLSTLPYSVNVGLRFAEMAIDKHMD